ncbi:preprotein translocase subunit SecG [Lactiplantibacillus mudanjiangensis]|uniref:Protein-export membrane protein SecG n=1 Tax=Lactiplantibacillus mudanjiangensis TaxID=1296538 RepID=A0A660DYI0_9LACO|nr:preprotein translocase subunit SecG [Lactiplantibacillus mudanjiangensis]VDG17896.1 preprotein translocase subunit SecG [Lactobacillus plantarum JDM1] [Lactiplantibacillus mudanjiangensis]VDG28309.1 preprotein translocase subunit SecG [Lactobacillus plantarum JDM1] [Lactiplantibacillus mudanjiangensis]VDG32403.1 preprotein translocase subunit SecG [Lactobacillus plantarum JDM1] [Lactiplantibacillus mudanjiangensis]
MYNTLMTIILVVSVIIIIAVMMQPSKTNDAMSSLTGGADDLFAKQKPRGFEAFMQKVTVVLGIIFFVVALALAWYSSK